MRKSLHILLVVPADLEFGRGVIQGVIRYAATTNWILSHAILDGHGTLHEGTSQWLQEERGGIIALVESASQASFFKSFAVPCVSVSSALDDPELPCVACDDKMIGGIAASHFLERRMRNFAFVGLPGRTDSDARFSGFCDRLGVDGFAKIESYQACESFDADGFQNLGQWIDTLSKPVGIFAMNDALGRSVIDACRAASIRVPSNVAVLGCGNDPVTCGLATPSLSSVALPAERVGFDAADLLAALLAQKRLVDKRRQVNVSSVIPADRPTTFPSAIPMSPAPCASSWPTRGNGSACASCCWLCPCSGDRWSGNSAASSGAARWKKSAASASISPSSSCAARICRCPSSPADPDFPRPSSCPRFSEAWSE